MAKALEAFTLSQIVNLMLEEEEKTTVTYHDDGSNSQGVGGYSVQGINVNNYLPPAHTSHLIRDKAEPG